LPKNTTWATDLTTVTDANGKQNLVFGFSYCVRNKRFTDCDACLSLENITTKHSYVLLRHLLHSIKLYGKPKAIRTDNEVIFTSLLFRGSLKLLGIKHQRSDKHCPWQNGRIERFFGTGKGVRALLRQFN